MWVGVYAPLHIRSARPREAEAAATSSDFGYHLHSWGFVEFERTRGRNVRNTDGHDVVLKHACDDDSVVSWVFYPALEKE